jgi:hypothetical protein
MYSEYRESYSLGYTIANYDHIVVIVKSTKVFFGGGGIMKKLSLLKGEYILKGLLYP